MTNWFLITYILVCSGLHADDLRNRQSLVGNWKSDCVELGRHSYISTLTFSENTLVIITRFFESRECTSHSLTGTYHGNYSSEFVDDKLYKILHTPTSAKFTLHLPQVVKLWNDPDRTDGCQRKNWTLNTPQEVSGKYCRPFHMPKKGKRLNDLIEIGDEQLRLGRSPAIVGDLKKQKELPHPIFKRIH